MILARDGGIMAEADERELPFSARKTKLAR